MLRSGTIVSDHDFERQYLTLREKEGRLYTDAAVACLPEVPVDHPLRKEWEIRERSAQHFCKYLKNKNRSLNILEVGCGNGWLSHQVSLIDNTIVTGIDINRTELQQAQRVFQKANLSFFNTDLRKMPKLHSYDIILFAASFQYFPSVEEILEACCQRLKFMGEVHILDTHFYNKPDSALAKERSTAYFIKHNVPEMDSFYFHHTLQDLNYFAYDILYDPHSLVNRFRSHSPFPWIRIKPIKR